MNYYELLEVNPKASAEVIRAAYKSLMQRYHPDKNPGNAAIAERATQVVRAYEVLSDPSKRLIYDAELAAPKTAAPVWTSDAEVAALRGRVRRTAPARESRMFWFGCLIILIIIASWLAMRSMQKSAANRAAAPAVKAAAPVASGDAVAPSAPVAPKPAAREMPAFATNLTVKLRNPQPPFVETGRVLTIPALTLRLGSVDPEGAMRHLGNMREQVMVRLLEDLALVRYEDLLGSDAAAIIARRIVETVNDAAGTARAPTLPAGASGVPVGGGVGGAPGSTAGGPDPAERYGVVDALLPEGFLIR